MADPSTAREALIVEALGEVARLIRQVEGLEPVLAQSCQAVKQANALLNDKLVDFERQMTAITDNAKGRAVQHVAARIDDALRRSIDQQSRAMADAARVANISSEVGSIALRQEFRTPSYAIGKAAQNMATSLLAQALASRGIVVVALHPGWVRTDMGGEQALLAPQESVAGLIRVIDRLSLSDSGAFLDWQGQTLPW